MPYEIIKPVSVSECKDFINKYHKTGKGGNAIPNIRFGVYTNNKLRGVNTYGANLSAGQTARTLFNVDDDSLNDKYVDNLRLLLLKKVPSSITDNVWNSSGSNTAAVRSPPPRAKDDNNNKKLMEPSTFVSFCDKIIFKYKPEIKFIVAYGAGVDGFTGTIYQAANYHFTGLISTNFWYIPNYGLVSRRSILIGSKRDSESIKKAYPNARYLTTVNFRYIKFKDQQTKDELMKIAKFKIIPNKDVPKKEDIPIKDDQNNYYPFDYFRKNGISFMPYLLAPR